MKVNYYAVIFWSWIIFLVYWIANARRVKPVAEQQSRAGSAPYRLTFTAGFLLLCWPPPHPPTGAPPAVGALLCVLGLCVAIWARRTLAGNWSVDVTFKQDHELVTRGPYRFVRHPIYTGMLLMSLGTALANGQPHAWLGFALQCLSFWIKLRHEESLMLQHFPDQYPSYRQRVKAIVPYII